MPVDARTRARNPEQGSASEEALRRESQRVPAPGRGREPKEVVVVAADAPTTTPIEAGQPIIEPPAKQAGGLAAVLSSTRYMLRESGVKRGLKVLTAVNQ